MTRSLLPTKVERYVTQEIARETPVQKRLRAETARLPQGGMQIGADQGALLALLVHSIGAIFFMLGAMGHIYMGTLGMAGAYDAMRTGYVDEEWARRLFRRFVELARRQD